MAGVTGERLPATEIGLIHGRHHENHPAGSLLFQLIIGRIVFPAAIGTVTILTEIAQGRGEKAHGGHELIDRQVAQHFDVFEEDASGQRLLFRRGLRLCESNWKIEKCCSDEEWDQSRSKINVASLLVCPG